MKKYSSVVLKKSSVLAFTILAFFAFQSSAKAENNTLDWRVDGVIQGEYNSNIAQIKTNTNLSDFINSYIGIGTLRYTAPTNTQIIARLQGSYNKYIRLSDFDIWVFNPSILAYQWFFNSLNVYVGGQPIFVSSTKTGKSALDWDILGGFTYYYPFGSSMAFGGYQIDKLQAQDKDYSSLNHTILLGFRQELTDNLIGNIGTKVRIRDVSGLPDDQRYIANVNLQYILNQWLTLQASGDYTYIASKDATRNLGVFRFGLNIIGGYTDKISF